MQLSRFHPTLVLFLLVLAAPGCFRSNRPEGLPKLYPCSVTVIQEGKPLAEASIKFVGGVSDQWPVTGLTDDSGKAVMVTYGQFPGAPLGDYRVVINKTVHEILSQGGEDTSGSKDIFSLVEDEFINLEKTPLKITVTTGNNTSTFDVGKKVHILIDSVRPGT